MADKIKIEIEADLEDLIPGYLTNLGVNIKKIETAAQSGDFETSRVLGHNMKGSGGGYGFDFISEMGKKIETGSRNSDVGLIDEAVVALRDYLERVDIVYV